MSGYPIPRFHRLIALSVTCIFSAHSICFILFSFLNLQINTPISLAFIYITSIDNNLNSFSSIINQWIVCIYCLGCFHLICHMKKEQNHNSTPYMLYSSVFSSDSSSDSSWSTNVIRVTFASPFKLINLTPCVFLP